MLKSGKLSLSNLGTETEGGCDFIEDAFEDTFSSTVLNVTRWMPDQLDGQEHCVGLAPSGPQTCTMMLGSQVKLAQPFPAYLGDTKSRGAILTLSQAPCLNSRTCCNSKGNNCANWAGSHLVSAGCIQYGVLEIDAAFDMPPSGYGFYFTATYIVYGSKDESWNELDIGMSACLSPALALRRGKAHARCLPGAAPTAAAELRLRRACAASLPDARAPCSQQRPRAA